MESWCETHQNGNYHFLHTPNSICKKLSLEKVTESLRRSFEEDRQKFLSGKGVPWLEHTLERHSPEPRVKRSGVGYVSVLDVDEFLNTVVGHL